MLELDDGTAIAQSPAILWLLADGTPFLPADPVARRAGAAVARVRAGARDEGIGGPRFWHLTGRRRGPAGWQQGVAALALLDAELARRDWLVGARCTIADLAVHGYAHRAGDVGVSLGPARARVGGADPRAAGVRRRSRPYGENARPGAGRSIYG